MGSSDRSAVVLNGVRVDFDDETLRERSGAIVPLRRQSFAVLRVLAERPNRVVGKDEIMAAVWPGIAVTDDSLVQCVGDIRRAIGDDAHTVLRTEPRRGYRLIPGAGDRTRARLRWAGAAALILAAVAVAVASWRSPEAPAAAVPLVAVAPFTPVGSDASSRLLAQGLTGDLIADLATFPEFGVLSQSATQGWRAGADDLRALAADLGASFVVSGSVARHGESLRVTAQLEEATRGATLWSQRWQGPADDFFAIQKETSLEIANRIGGGAGVVQAAGRIAAHRQPPSSLGAYELYLLGTERLERVTRADLEAAVALLTQAVERDPGFARAWLELFHAHDALSGLDPGHDSDHALAAAAAARALALDPLDAEAHAVAAMSHARSGAWARSREAFEAALRLAPNSAEILTFYGAFASNFGEAGRGAEMADRARRLDPEFPAWKAKFYSYAYFVAGRYEDALDMVDRLETSAYSPFTWAIHAGALAALGRDGEARAWVARALEARPGYSIETVINHPGPDAQSRELFAGQMRAAGFSPCAEAESLAGLADPRRLPECAAGGGEIARD